MMPASVSLTAGAQPVAAMPGKVSVQTGEAAASEAGDPVSTLFAGLLEGEPALPVEPAADVTNGEDACDEAPSLPVMTPVLAGQSLTPEEAVVVTTAAPLLQLEQMVAEKSSPASLLSTVQDPVVAEPLLTPEADAVADAVADVVAKPDAALASPGEVRTLSPALLALGLAAPREVRSAQQVEWAAVPVVPQTEGGKPQALQQLLAERLAVQSSHGMDRALIRLDPPRFGALEISLQQEGGRLLVQLSASHGEVVRQLQGIGDVLRQELGQRQFHTVQVDIRHSMHDGQQQGGRQQSQQQAEPGRALQLDEEGNFAASYAAEDMQA